MRPVLLFFLPVLCLVLVGCDTRVERPVAKGLIRPATPIDHAAVDERMAAVVTAVDPNAQRPLPVPLNPNYEHYRAVLAACADDIAHQDYPTAEHRLTILRAEIAELHARNLACLRLAQPPSSAQGAP